MKKAVYFTLALVLISIITNAGNPDPLFRAYKLKANGGAKCFDESTRVINVGIGFGYSYYDYTTGQGITVRNLPTISVSYEQPWTKRFGPGLMGVGGYLAFKASSWKNNYNDGVGGTYSYKEVNNNTIIASRAMYHWDVLNKDKAEVYGGVILGVRINAYHYTSEFGGTAAGIYQNTDESSMSLDVVYSLVAGARYYFKPKFGVYAEASYGISFINLGLSIKL